LQGVELVDRCSDTADLTSLGITHTNLTREIRLVDRWLDGGEEKVFRS
jgi:hypothetical protein